MIFDKPICQAKCFAERVLFPCWVIRSWACVMILARMRFVIHTFGCVLQSKLV